MCNCANAGSAPNTATEGAGNARNAGEHGISVPDLTRRSAFSTVGGGAVVGVLSACGNGAEDGNGAEEDGSPEDGGNGAADGDALTTTDEIPVGEGTVFSDEEVVVTQPEEGTFRAFSTTCTHEGCPVDEVADGEINCPCHGSRFSIDDGSPVAGPADSPLEEVQITVDGDQISLA